MPEPIVLSLSAGQVAEFRALDAQEAQARKVVDSVPIARTYAARGIVLQSYTAQHITDQPLHIDCTTGTITFVPNEVTNGG